MAKRKVRYSRKFIKSLEKAPTKVQTAFRKRLELYLTDKFHPLLRNHALLGKYLGYRSLNVTGDWRALFRESGTTTSFLLLGTHSKLYK